MAGHSHRPRDRQGAGSNRAVGYSGLMKTARNTALSDCAYFLRSWVPLDIPLGHHRVHT